MTYAQVEDKVKALGSGIENLGLAPAKAQYKDYNLRFVGVHSKNNQEFVLTDLTNLCYGYVTMPLYDTLGEEAVDFMLEETELTTLFLTSEHIKKHTKRIKAGKAKFLKNLVILDEKMITASDLQDLEGVNWFRFSQVIEEGLKNLRPYPKITPENIACFSYTSGTTGTPKGAMISHKNLVSLISGAEAKLTYLTADSVYISYLPLAHIFEKVVFLHLTYLGGKIGMFGGDVLKIKEDLAILKPTIFVSVPRLFNKFYDTIKAKMSDLTGCKSSLARRAINAKLANVDKG